MIARDLTQAIKDLLGWYPVVSVVGPRQSGKSTLLRSAFPDYEYLDLEDLTIREAASTDPVGFIRDRPGHLIIDEAQLVPELFSMIKVVADEKPSVMGQYILSGSQNFLLQRSIGQSLAGRVGGAVLLPLSFREIRASASDVTADEFLFRGGYPHLYDVPMPADVYFRDYVKTYVQRDVGDLLDVRNLASFQKFLRLCACGVGGLLNVSNLANRSGVTFATAKVWLSILESSYVIHLLRPYSDNSGKRLTRSPKLYFLDTGLLNYLLDIDSLKQLLVSNDRGAVFENMVVSEAFKAHLNANEDPDLCFYRDRSGCKVDLVDLTDQSRPELVEVKAGRTAKTDMLRNLASVGEYLDVPRDQRTLVYRGDQAFSTDAGRFLPVEGWLLGEKD